MQIQVVHN